MTFRKMFIAAAAVLLALVPASAIAGEYTATGGGFEGSTLSEEAAEVTYDALEAAGYTRAEADAWADAFISGAFNSATVTLNADGTVATATFEFEGCTERMLNITTSWTFVIDGESQTISTSDLDVSCGSIVFDTDGNPAFADTDADSTIELAGVNGVLFAELTATEDAGALPQTGGEFMWLLAGLLVLGGSGLALRRATRPRTDEA